MHLLPDRRSDRVLGLFAAACVGWLGFVAGWQPAPVAAEAQAQAESHAMVVDTAGIDAVAAASTADDYPAHPCYPFPCVYPCYPHPCVIFPYPIRCYDPNFPPVPPRARRCRRRAPRPRHRRRRRAGRPCRRRRTRCRRRRRAGWPRRSSTGCARR